MAKKGLMALLEEKGIRRERCPKFSSFNQYIEFIHERALNDPVVSTAVPRTCDNYYRNYLRVAERYPDMFELAKEVRRIKEYSIDHLDELVRVACDNIEENKGHCYLAKDAEEARRIAGEIVGSGKTVVKVKSLTTEEIFLREYLEELGNEVYETDLGEFLVQALGPKPMHFTSPALHLTREKVAEFLEKAFGRPVDRDDIPGMVKMVREFLREKFCRADVGVSGANALAADPGALFILTNEGNGRLATSTPPVHIAVVGVEKIVPTLSDAFKVSEVIMRFSGYKSVSYLSIIAGPSKTGDIEKKVTYGAHGPRELHVILLDNGRMKAAKDPEFKEALYCLRCGACHYVCPIFRMYGGFWGGEVYAGGIGIIWTYITQGLREAYFRSFLCLGDKGCTEHCPMDIDQARMLKAIRRRGVEEARREAKKLMEG